MGHICQKCRDLTACCCGNYGTISADSIAETPTQAERIAKLEAEVFKLGNELIILKLQVTSALEILRFAGGVGIVPAKPLIVETPIRNPLEITCGGHPDPRGASFRINDLPTNHL